jgi:hypothetical protein
LATIYRYRRGESSPGERLLKLDEEIFIVARSVYENGPFQVPLWDSMWGSITPADVALAGSLMPKDTWNPAGIYALLFDDVVLARLMRFQATASWGNKPTLITDLQTLSTAIRVCRANRLLNRGDADQLRLLVESCCSLPGARCLLSRVGILALVQRWIADEFGAADSATGAIYSAEWMRDEDLFDELCKQAEERRSEIRGQLLSGGDKHSPQEREAGDEDTILLH